MTVQQQFTFNVCTSRPQTLDPGKAVGGPEVTVMHLLFDGLTVKEQNGEIRPGVAHDWEISDEGKTYRFYLRKCYWSNGDLVTAHDFIRAWKRVLSDQHHQYAFLLYRIKNAQAFHQGQGVSFEQVGVSAIDDHVLQVELIKPTPQFIRLISFHTFFPIHASVMEQPDWERNPQAWVSNGPFTLASFMKDGKVTVERSDTYWDLQAIHLEKVIFTFMENAHEAWEAYRRGEIDGADDSSIPIDKLQEAIRHQEVHYLPYVGTYYYIFHHHFPVLRDVKVRKALGLAIDYSHLMKEMEGGGYTQADAFVPPGITGEKGDFRQEGGALLEDYDLDRAKVLLKEAGYPGGKGFPEIPILVNNSDLHHWVAQELVTMWEALGIRCRIETKPFKDYLALRNHEDYALTRSGWIADYDDPLTFLDLFESTTTVQESGNYHNPDYDRLIASAREAVTLQEQMNILHQAEKQLMEDMAVLPLFYYRLKLLLHPSVKNLGTDPLGPVIIRYTKISEAKERVQQ